MPQLHTRNLVLDLNKLTTQNYAARNKDLLHGFIYVRLTKGWKVPLSGSEFKWLNNKENIIKTNRGEYNYISLAYIIQGI